MLTTITSLIARPGRETAVVEDFDRAFAEAGSGSHHLGTLLIQQRAGLNFLVSQFADANALERWQQSATHRDMVRAFERDSLRELCTIPDRVVRISVPSDSSGPKWKVFVSTWTIIYPLLLLISFLLDRLAPGLPSPGRLAISSAALSIASIWVLTPLTHAITRVWRLRNQQMQIEVLGQATGPEDGDTRTTFTNSEQPVA